MSAGSSPASTAPLWFYISGMELFPLLADKRLWYRDAERTRNLVVRVRPKDSPRVARAA